MSKKRRSGRAVNGVLLLDKPLGISSNQALQKAKQLYFARKAGHTGSLDPQASGLLPLCFGEATKISSFLLDSDKRYVAVCALGEKTRTGDTEGEVIETRPVPVLNKSAIEKILADFRGLLEQIPPMHSAIKHNGQPLYKLAHQGLEVERQPRQVTIKHLQLLDFGEDSLELDVLCSKGTYIRTLVEDIGEAIGCGAHVKAMRRVAAGPYDLSQAHTLESLEGLAGKITASAGWADYSPLDSLLLSVETALEHWPAVNVNADSSFYLRQGQPVFVPHAPEPGWVRLYEKDNRFLGMGKVLEDGRVAPKRLIQG